MANTRTYRKIDDNTIEVTLTKKWNLLKQEFIDERAKLEAELDEINLNIERFDNA